jgi:glutathione S-transferase
LTGLPDSLILHEDPVSGNCYKIRLTAALLGIALERRFYDITNGDTRTEAFLTQVDANGRIPVLQAGDRFLPESNAACFYLADGSQLVPDDRFARADMLRWMFFEQYQHEPNIATMRFWLHVLGEGNLSPQQRAMMETKRKGGQAALALMDRHLSTRDWFVAGGNPTLADIALFAYTHVAHEGGFSLNDFGAIRAWIERMRALPRFTPMQG